MIYERSIIGAKNLTRSKTLTADTNLREYVDRPTYRRKRRFCVDMFYRMNDSKYRMLKYIPENKTRHILISSEEMKARRSFIKELKIIITFRE